MHPIADSLTTPPDEATVVLSRGGPSNGESAQLIAAFRERFERREVVETIGDMDGAESTTFALLWDAAITEAGEILVLDRIQTNVRWRPVGRGTTSSSMDYARARSGECSIVRLGVGDWN